MSDTFRTIRAFGTGFVTALLVLLVAFTTTYWTTVFGATDWGLRFKTDEALHALCDPDWTNCQLARCAGQSDARKALAVELHRSFDESASGDDFLNLAVLTSRYMSRAELSEVRYRVAAAYLPAYRAAFPSTNSALMHADLFCANEYDQLRRKQALGESSG